jgi:hypothetical protein
MNSSIASDELCPGDKLLKGWCRWRSQDEILRIQIRTPRPKLLTANPPIILFSPSSQSNASLNTACNPSPRPLPNSINTMRTLELRPGHHRNQARLLLEILRLHNLPQRP